MAGLETDFAEGLAEELNTLLKSGELYQRINSRGLDRKKFPEGTPATSTVRSFLNYEVYKAFFTKEVEEMDYQARVETFFKFFNSQKLIKIASFGSPPTALSLPAANAVRDVALEDARLFTLEEMDKAVDSRSKARHGQKNFLEAGKEIDFWRGCEALTANTINYAVREGLEH